MLPQFVSILTIFSSVSFLFQESFIKKFFSITLYLTANYVSDFFIASLSKFFLIENFGKLYQNTHYSFVMVLGVYFLILCYLLLFTPLLKKVLSLMADSLLKKIFIIPLSHFAAVFTIDYMLSFSTSNTEEFIILLNAFFSVLLNWIFYFFMLRILESMQFQMQNQELHQQLELQFQCYHLLKEELKKRNRLSHDFKNHFYTLSRLLEDETVEDDFLKNYLAHLKMQCQEINDKDKPKDEIKCFFLEGDEL